MNLEECLRGELAEVVALAEAVAPELARPQSWAARLARFLARWIL